MGKVFGTAFFGGFKKKDVVRFLDDLGQEHRSELRNLEETIVLLKEQLSQLRQQADSAEQTACRQETELESLSSAAQEAALREARLCDRLEALTEENRILNGKLAEAMAENRVLGSRILDFSDERRSLEAERDRIIAEAQERQAELEARIFDLEAEVLEGFEHKTEAWEAGVTAPAGKVATAETEGRKSDLRLNSVKDILKHVKRK